MRFVIVRAFMPLCYEAIKNSDEFQVEIVLTYAVLHGSVAASITKALQYCYQQ